MRLGVHTDALAESLNDADRVLILGSEDLQWDPGQVAAALGDRARLVSDADELVEGSGASSMAT